MRQIQPMKSKDKGIKHIAWLFILTFGFEIIFPSLVFAGGPTQPEVTAFTPVGVSDMVDPFTGDFTYNLPLMNVEGYPLNIAYNAGISMDQEASWVGLGWNLNVGSVVRNLRGLPDDFSGDMIEKETSMKPNRTYSINGVFETELLGKKVKKPATNASSAGGSGSTGNTAGSGGTGSTGGSGSTGGTGGTPTPTPPTSVPELNLKISVGLNYNNYNGFGVEFSLGPSFGLSKASGHKMTAGFSLSGSSENGAAFAPSVSYEASIQKKDKSEKTLGGNIGSSMNSRSGLTGISYGFTKVKQSGKSSNLGLRSNGSYNLGLATYSPTAGPNMQNLSINGSFKFGIDAFGADPTLTIGVGFSSQWIPEDQKSIKNPAYGYFNLDKGQNMFSALLDFNRDNDGSFTKETPFLPTAQLTYDIFSLNAQGVNGSYRGFRNDIGYVFDPEVRTTSDAGDAGVELGNGSTLKYGFDVSYNHTSAKSGGWDGNLNYAANHFNFKSNKWGFTSNYAMQEANEKSVEEDNLFREDLGENLPLIFDLKGDMKWISLQNTLMINKDVEFKKNPNYDRKVPIKRNQLMQFTNHFEMTKGLGVDAIHPNIYSGAANHHIGEVIQTGTDGRRYVFGIAAYNHFQEEITFAAGKRINGNPGLNITDSYNGLIYYGAFPSLASKDNDLGLDNYYSCSKTPAYAHSFLLTSVLSDDYVDSDNEKGPSINDIGTYVKFDYEKVDNYKWRTPLAAGNAFRNEGMKTDPSDDKASIVYGEKDLWYVKGIETKNYIAVFTLGEREDGHGVTGKHGGVSANSPSMKRLEKISLYSRPDYELNGLDATPIQEVHFVYDYHLCGDYPGNYTGGGKLTLLEIYFTYQGSNRMKHSPYVFNYNSENPEYNLKAVDRWGNYKPTSSGLETPIDGWSSMNNADYPYTNQNSAETDLWAAAWSLTDIQLPSGGAIHVEYESDDYGFVQNKRAMKMFKIVSTSQKVNYSNTDFNGYGVHSVSEELNTNHKIYFKLEPGHEDINEYVTKDKFLYFRCLTEFLEDLGDNDKYKYEYVSGYGQVANVGVETHQGIKLGWISFKGMGLKDNDPEIYNPITKAAIQFGRLHLSKIVNNIGVNEPSDDNSDQSLKDFAQAVVNSLGSIGELFTGPNMAIYNKNRGRRIVTNKSWIRMEVPTHKKLGGGLRVKKILMRDNWSAMTGQESYDYGQEFSYTNSDGSSSGVASYEPQIGGDENPWKQPVTYSNKLRFSPDQTLYQEEPIAESLFPSPSVGYSRVTIRDIQRNDVTRTATGKVVKEFYTAKDFPTIVKASEKLMKSANSFLPLLPKYQYMGVSQGFSIELNDMHGKQKREIVYSQGIDDAETAISQVSYYYQKENLNAADNTFVLKNRVKVIHPDGSTSEEEIGVRNEAVADFRKSSTNSVGGSADFNFNTTIIGLVPVIIPTIWPSISITDNEFKSATLTKITNRFGILDSTIANQDGSIVKTENLAYDFNTGEVLSTQTTTNFNDKVYSMNFPAYWKYDQLGQGYKNLDYAAKVNFNNAGFTQINNARSLFVEGDEINVYSTSTNSSNTFLPFKAWILKVSDNGITVVDKYGTPVINQNTKIVVKRSGRRNKQMTSMASLTSMSDIVGAISTNTYKNVLNAGAIEYSQEWKTFCSCFNSAQNNTTNPYVMGLKGNMRPVKSYTHLSGRTQSSFDLNSNIRRDGVFTSYNPFYKLDGSRWVKDGKNWTFVSEVTQFSPNGMTLETKDALGRFSSSLYSFNNTLTTAVAANASLKQVANTSFEDVLFSSCTSDLFFSENSQVTDKESHTGKYSLLVQPQSPVNLGIQDNSCAFVTCSVEIINNQGHYQVVNGILPYQLDVEVLSGDIDAELGPNGYISLTGDTSNYDVIFTVTDANGCVIIYNAKNQ